MRKRIYLSALAFTASLTMAFGQLTGNYSYDFRDGSIITAGKSADDKLTLSGTYSLHGATYGMNMKVNGNINIAVAGASTVRFLGSKYSSLNMQGTATTTNDLGTQNTKVTTDLVDTYDFVYNGAGGTLNFKTTTGSGNDLYLPLVEIVPAQLGASATSAVKNIIYNFDLRDGSIIPNNTSLNGNYTIEQGLFKIEPGASNGFGYNGSTHGSIMKTGNKITLKVAGNSYIKLGGCQYSGGTVAIASTTGIFDKASQSTKTTKCYHEDGSTVDFLYAGTAGTVELTFTGTTYLPIVQIVPVPYAVELTPWVQKSGVITVNGTDINFTAGATSTSNPTIALSAGTLVSATPDAASVRINLGGNALSTYTPTFTGNIAGVTVNGDKLQVTFADAASNPKTYTISVADNSVVKEAEAGKTYTYNFADGSVLPQTSYTALRYSSFVAPDGLLTLNSNTATSSGQFGFHDAAHGAVFFPGNSMDVTVAGNATLTFVLCTYGVATDAVFEVKDAQGNVLGTSSAQNIGLADGATSSFTYTGAKGVITATLKSANFPTAEVYIHAMSVENAAAVEPVTGKVDVWDFGGEQLDAATYSNKLNVDVINAWYPSSVTAGSSGINFPSTVSAGVMSWVGGTNDRLRTTNTSLTRYDANIASVVGYTGRLYVNGISASRYLSLTLSEDDEVTLVMKTDAGGTINFQYVPDPAAQTDKTAITSDLTELKFVAKQAGTYHIFDPIGKPSYFRVYRKDATYKTVTGLVDVTAAAGIPEGYAIQFTNTAGKTWKATMTGNNYSVKLPVGYTYKLTLADANGYVIGSDTSLPVTESTTTFGVTVQKVELYTVSGSIVGLGTDISKLGLVFTPDAAANKIYKPEPVVNTTNGTYSVSLEPNCEYTLSATGVNDYTIPSNKLTVTGTTTADITFAAKTRYNVAVTAPGLTAEQLGKLSLTFTNLKEAGYSYSFASASGIALRDGTYSVASSGLDDYPLEQALTSNLKVNGANVAKELTFTAVTNWPFDDKDIVNGTPSYKGMLFTGTAYNEKAKGHLACSAGATLKVPVKVGEKVTFTYYYAANFSVEGGSAIVSASGSTSTFESTEYTYTGTEAGYVNVAVAGTTYFTHVKVSKIIPYQAVLTVGTDKQYLTINEALEAVRQMVRTSEQRVTIQIDPGNYEEMLVVDVPNVTLKNAAVTPDIALLNKGVDISANAVRITSYYGHGYNYYSMQADQKWHADALAVNKENGYLSYENKGSGTTNGSYWNATVVVSAVGFVAEDIIFENSFNQYISKKESEDVVVMWEVGNKGARPTDKGNTAVQNKSFVERAAAIAFMSSADKAILNKCRVVGRQDSFFGGNNARVVIYKGSMMGGTDYLFGGMVAVFYKSDLAMNTSDASGDVAYITAAQQSSGRGYLMYECNVTSALPGTETASTYLSKPGYFGRPWQATTSEVVFYNTTVQASNATGYVGKSLIEPLGWLNTLGGESVKMYEFGTTEKSGENNQSSRAAWSTLLSQATLTDGTAINTFNFTKGADSWDPLPALIAADPQTSIVKHNASSAVTVFAAGGEVYVSNVKASTTVNVYNVSGRLMKSLVLEGDSNFSMDKGLWIVNTISADGQQATKVVIR